MPLIMFASIRFITFIFAYIHILIHRTMAEYSQDGPEARRIASVIPYYPFHGIDRFYGEDQVVRVTRAPNTLIRADT
jgi:hypothetical protein